MLKKTRTFSKPASLFGSQSIVIRKLTFTEARRENSHSQESFKMKFVIVAVFMAIYLMVGAHSASISHTISKDKLNMKGSVDVSLSIPIEEVWDSLSQGQKYVMMIIFVAKTLIR